MARCRSTRGSSGGAGASPRGRKRRSGSNREGSCRTVMLQEPSLADLHRELEWKGAYQTATHEYEHLDGTRLFIVHHPRIRGGLPNAHQYGWDWSTTRRTYLQLEPFHGPGRRYPFWTVDRALM